MLQTIEIWPFFPYNSTRLGKKCFSFGASKDNGAYKLFPQRMEELNQQLSGVSKCGVIVQKDEKRKYVPVVFLTTDPTISAKNIKTIVASEIENNLPKYYEPKDIVVLDEMPVNSNQKIDYRTLELKAK